MNLIKEYSKFVMAFADSTGHYGFLLLIVLESTFIPLILPAEAILLSAGYLVGLGKMNIYFTIFLAVLGTLIGSFINYFFANWFGRDFLYHYGKYFLLNKKRIQKAELLFNANSGLITFLGRFLPFLKHIVSIPAGLVGMNPLKFSFFTGLGALIFSTILLVTGMKIGENIDDLHKVKPYVEIGFVVFAIVILIVFACYYLYSKKVEKKGGE